MKALCTAAAASTDSNALQQAVQQLDSESGLLASHASRPTVLATVAQQVEKLLAVGAASSGVRLYACSKATSLVLGSLAPSRTLCLRASSGAVLRSKPKMHTHHYAGGLLEVLAEVVHWMAGLEETEVVSVARCQMRVAVTRAVSTAHY